MHVHAFSPLEVWHGAHTLGLSLEDYLTGLREAGLSSLPGTAAEILDDEVRDVLCGDKIRTAEWFDVMRAAHRVGLRSTSTIMFGHIERTEHWARHIRRIRDLQQETGGFTEFVPLPFVHMEAPIYLKGAVLQTSLCWCVPLDHDEERLLLWHQRQLRLCEHKLHSRCSCLCTNPKQGGRGGGLPCTSASWCTQWPGWPSGRCCPTYRSAPALPLIITRETHPICFLRFAIQLTAPVPKQGMVFKQSLLSSFLFRWDLL